MRILYGKTFGLGNAVCSIPALKALTGLYPDAVVDVLVGNTHDDIGAIDVLFHFLEIDHLITSVDKKSHYDIAIMAIPFDGRWIEGRDFFADVVIDGRGRPNHSQVYGFSSWEKHEIEYQMDNVRELGYRGETPDCSFLPTRKYMIVTNNVYLGLGYKKDQAGFWAKKHWGNEKYASLIKMMLERHPNLNILTSGDELDRKMTIWPIQKLLRGTHSERFQEISVRDLQDSFDVVSTCSTFVGNDTGMAHVAASLDMNVAVYYNMDNAWTKSHPWCKNYEIVKGHDHEVSVEEMYTAFRKVHYGENS